MTDHDFADDIRGPDAPGWRDHLERLAVSALLALFAAAAGLGSLIGLTLNFG